jgi:hypothetical protein
VCYALFIGSSEPLAMESSDEGDGHFHLEGLQPESRSVLRLFSKPHVYYAASWQGCGCGWFGDAALFESPRSRRESRAKSSADVAGLRNLLIGLLTSVDFVELYLGWEGEFDEPVQRFVVLDPGSFESDSLPMKLGDFAQVRQQPLS